jgi:acyl-CoA synthetase (AMP-forming)/AMP-acid ligase II
VNEALPRRVDAIVRMHALATPDAPALMEDGRTLSYRQLQDEIDACAAWLRGLGVQPGERVMLASENCAAQVAALFAVASLDACFVNVNARLTAPELDAIRSHCGARVVLYTAAVSTDAAAHAARAGAGACTHGELMASLHPDDGIPEPVQTEPTASGSPAALVYTTGTTGRPKGVILSHCNLLFVADVSSRLRGLAPGDLAYGVLPVSHVYGLSSVLLGTLSAGACLRLAPRFTPRAMLDAIRKEKLSIVQGVPAMYARLLELCRADEVQAPLASTLRFAYAGGSPLDPTLKAEVEALLGVPLHNGYGLTEAAPTVSQTRLDAPRADTSVGHPIPGVEVRIAGPDGREAAEGEAGQLWVRGPNVMQGYYRDPEATRAVLRADGWLDTGDLARRAADGALFIAGRSKELIIRSGFKVYPLEVETVLNAHPAVTQSAVVGRSLPDGNEEVVAFVQPATGSALAIEELQEWASARLAPYKRPARIVMMDSLPAAPSGKVLKHRLH